MNDYLSHIIDTHMIVVFDIESSSFIGTVRSDLGPREQRGVRQHVQAPPNAVHYGIDTHI